MLRAAVPAAASAVMVAAVPGIAQAAPASTRVPCDPTALASDISGAANGATLGLPADCGYVLTAPLPTVSRNLTINGNGATVERSTAAGTPAFVILTVSSGTLSLHKLSFTNGDGAILVTQSGNLSVSGGTFSQNQAPQGGAVNIDGGTSTETITSATFTGNTATGTGGLGGAIYNGDFADTTVTKCTFTGNQAVQGGAIFDFAVNGATITSSTFTGNTAADGGAILNDPIGGESLSKDTISGNSASQDGGGIYSNLTSVSVQNSVITGNQAGGGIYQNSLEYGEVGPNLTSTRVTKNSAANGGGIYINASVADLTGSTVSGNTATADGGGIDNAGSFRSFDTLNLATSKITDNQAGADGGGVYNVGDLSATSTPITYNTAAGGGGIYDGPGTDTVTLTTSGVQHNKIDNCEPAASIPGCTG